MTPREKAVVIDARTHISRCLRMIKQFGHKNVIICVNGSEAVVRAGRESGQAGPRIASLKGAELLIRVFGTKPRLAPSTQTRNGGG